MNAGVEKSKRHTHSRCFSGVISLVMKPEIVSPMSSVKAMITEIDRNDWLEIGVSRSSSQRNNGIPPTSLMVICTTQNNGLETLK